MSNNVALKVKGTTLTITIDLNQAGEPSKSGKSTVIASTRGNATIPSHPDLRLGLNLYRVQR